MTVVALKGEERDVALAEVRAVLAAAPSGGYREQLSDIHDTLEEDGALGADETGELERLITIALQSGRVRALYGPGGEQALLRLYRKLPAGVEVAESAAAVTEALSGLAGRTLEQVSVAAVGPGAFRLTLAAGSLTFTVHLDRQGARLASVEA